MILSHCRYSSFSTKFKVIVVLLWFVKLIVESLKYKVQNSMLTAALTVYIFSSANVKRMVSIIPADEHHSYSFSPGSGIIRALILIFLDDTSGYLSARL